MKQMDFKSKAEYIGDYDVIVVGGGPSGTAASIAASRNGAKTLIIESTGCMGGNATSGGLPFWLGAKSQGREVVAGIYKELTDLMIAEKMTIGPGRSPSQGGKMKGMGITDDEVMFDLEGGKRAHENLAIKSGVLISYFTTAIMPKVKNKKIEGLYIHNKSGLGYVGAKVVIDCSGDADIAFDGGFETTKGDGPDKSLCPITLIWHAENVNVDELSAYLINGGDKRFRAVVEDAKTKGIWPWASDIIIMFPMMKDGVMMINGQSQINVDGTNAAEITKAMIDGRKYAAEYLEVLKRYIPGYKNAALRYVASSLGVRETRRIKAEYMLTTEDIVNGVEFDDVVALSGYHFDLGKPVKQADGSWLLVQPLHKNVNAGQSQPLQKAAKGYIEIPYRCLIPKGSVNLLVAGRCVGVEGQALGPIRVMAPCFAMGEAVGTAAAMSINENCSVQKISITALKEKLTSQGAIVKI
ncbi:MAG: hypothetical protein A2Y10_12885 [Planctomycetes bacterium GWF2_41_51]|nr:MAG: hypothetical protein A2Y10_12885 [Planctomycetes bacterium GWF2_41_51]HBG28232.1 hypothetical protein [Phycisphaerales bacterium]